MKKSLLLIVFLNLMAIVGYAQYNLTITYDATQGASTLQGAQKVYFHSGASDVIGPLDNSAWNYNVGNWGADDGIGQMTDLLNNVWTITFDPIVYYSQSVNGPVSGPQIYRIGMVFRDATGANFGKDVNNSEIYMNLSSGNPEIFNSDGSQFFGVTAGISSVGIQTLSNSKASIKNYPNPLSTHTIFEYNLESNQSVNLSIYDATGRIVNTLFNDMQSSGKHYYYWMGDDSKGNSLSGGIYYYSLSTGSEKVFGKININR